ncbi:hypothetical protein Tco_0856322 [Tanacetum coccineum]|uniref:Uncharacterized protein n=1 Tax=Tanacetum coccineum TaxID=301880 RepID=A0ABQ5B3H9_9ASTR
MFGTGVTTGAIMGSRTGVVIGSGPTGGWTGAVLCEQEGSIGPLSPRFGFTTEEVGIGGSVPDPEVEAVLAVTNLANISVRLSLVIVQFVCFDLHASDPRFGGAGAGAGAEAWFFLSKSNARTISLSSATSDETTWVEEFFPRNNPHKLTLIVESTHDVYSTKRILAVTRVEVMRKHGYRCLREIEVRRADYDLYTFKEVDFPRLRINDIEDMLILIVQNRLTNILGDDVFDFTIVLQMFTRSMVIQKRVKDLQLGVKSYQKKISVTKPKTKRPDIRKKYLIR